MNVLYLGTTSGTSGHRASALKRLGHDLEILNVADALPKLPLIGQWERYAGSIGLAYLVRTRMLKRLAGQGGFDVVWVDSGALVSRELVQDLKRVGKRVLNYNVDDPYGSRDINLWHQYRRAVPAYDLLVVVRTENIEEAKALKAKRILRVYRAADEVAHAQRELNEQEKATWNSEVLFVGTGFPERSAFFCELVRHGVPLSIYGNKWSESKEWKTLKHYWRGPGLEDAYSYSTAILAAKVSLGLLSKGNRDLHTTRSLEIPSLGGVFCAERTSEHLSLYREDEEAVFWSSAEECAVKCKSLLANDEWRRALATRGHERYLKNGWTNMKVAEIILRAAIE